MRNNPLVLAFAILTFAFAPVPAAAQEAQPGDPCTMAGYSVLSGGTEIPGGHLLLCDGSNWQPVLGYSSAGNRVMFGSSGTAAAPLHVWGEAIIGNEGLACTPVAEGAIRYHNTGYVPPAVTDGLVLHWKFDESSGSTASDSSGYGHHDSSVGGTWRPDDGKLGGAIEGGSIDVGSAVLHAIDDAATFAMWFKDNGTQTDGWYNAFHKIDFGASPKEGWAVTTVSGTNDMHIRIDTDGDQNQTEGIFPDVIDGEWHHIALTLDNGTYATYLDGVQTDTGSYNHFNGFGNTASFQIDAQPNVHGFYDDARYYDRALSATEIQDIYNSSGSAVVQLCDGASWGALSASALGTSLLWQQGAGKDIYYNGGGSGDANVGINESSAEARLEISGDGGSTYPLFMISSDDANDGDFFYVAHTSGNVGIGTNTPDQGKLEVKGGSVCVDTDSDNNASSCIASESDLRLKKNIHDLDYALDTLMQLRPVSFDWRYDDPEILKHYPLLSRFAGHPHSIGLVAQEVQPLVPEAIEQETVGNNDVQYLQLDYNKLVPVIIKAMQEQQAEIDALKSEIELLKPERPN